MPTETLSAESRKKHRPIEVTIDRRPYEVTNKEMTAEAILELRGRTPETYYLVEVLGRKERVSYKDRPQATIRLHQGSKFVTVSTGETPVS